MQENQIILMPKGNQKDIYVTFCDVWGEKGRFREGEELILFFI